MAKKTTMYLCESCGADQPKWQGQCPACGQWNTLVEARQPAPARQGARAEAAQRPQPLAQVAATDVERLPSGIGELDRVLGGGIVPGSVILLGGDPGIGKSTLLLQAAARVGASRIAVLYVTGEESVQQVAMRAQRLGLAAGQMHLLAETEVEQVLAQAEALGPRVLMVDSIQTIYCDALPSAPGSVSQLRESAARLVRHAKESAAAVFLIGHVTKEGTLAGPRVLEHMVDTVLYFESEAGSRYRIVRAVKNRYGAANEIGVFAMSEDGLREVRNPSAIFLSRHEVPVAGSVVLITWEGSRPLLVEVQALVAESSVGQPRRHAVGVEPGRLPLLLAVAQRHAGLSLAAQDVFINVVGGVQIDETAADLAVVLAAASSLAGRPISSDTVVFGELGLAGEVRPVPYGEERLREAAKQGYRRALVPVANVPRRPIDGLEVVGIARLPEALGRIRPADESALS